MSWGERSCKHYGNCTIATIDDCNIFCAAYKRNGETKKRFNTESILAEVFEECKKEEKSDAYMLQCMQDRAGISFYTALNYVKKKEGWQR